MMTFFNLSFDLSFITKKNSKNSLNIKFFINFVAIYDYPY